MPTTAEASDSADRGAHPHHLASRCRCGLTMVLFTTLLASGLIVSCAVLLPQEFVGMEQSRVLQDTYSRSTSKTSALFEQTVFQNVSARAMADMLQQLSTDLAEDMMARAERSSMTVLNILQSQGQVDIADQNNLIGAMAFFELARESLYGFPFSRRIKFGRSSSFDPSRPSLGWMKVGFASGQAVTVEIRRNATGQMVAATYISQLPGEPWAMRFPMSLVTGFVNGSAPGDGEHVRRLEPRTWCQFSKQEEHARAATTQPGTQVELRPAWSRIIDSKRLGPIISLGTPIAFCGNYSCLSGIVEIGIRLQLIAHYLLDSMMLVRYVLDARRRQFALFIIDISNQSQDAQRGLLISAYQYGADLPGKLVNATDANSSLISSTSKALFFAYWHVVCRLGGEAHVRFPTTPHRRRNSKAGSLSKPG
eukprot:TRINITY_DN11198_c0_g1_i1.p1 TRINITY_DN11198_c0_g1~~TRINITY_DN11198_c0_g1_i1.p1  ORF type:complete len:423 (-),score=42.58 TRINITY_DN11198_c0_g1_i1:370-1638(-)